MCSLRIACNGSRRDGEGYVERPNFFDVSAYGAAAENVHRYTRRGTRVAIDGRLEWREWETAEGGRRQAVSVVADSVQFLDSAGERAHAGDGEDPAGDVEDDLLAVGGEGEEIAF